MARPKSESPTLKEVAAAADVSPSTVSRIINNPGYTANDELRQRVLKAAAELHYQPRSRIRKSRIRGRIGVILPNVSNPMYTQALTGIETIARDYDYGVALGISLRDRGREFDYVSDMFSRKIEAIILSPVSDSVEGLREFIQRGLRVVLLDQELPGLDCSFIDFGLRSGVRLAVRHLVDNGHKRIGLVTLPLNRWNREEVRAGYASELTVNGIVYNESKVVIAEEKESLYGFNDDFAAGEKLGERLDLARLNVSALVALNGALACGLLASLQNRGIRIPEQMSLLSLEDVPGATLFKPALSVLQLPAFQVGQLAAMKLISKLGRKSPLLQNTEAKPRLILRDSTRSLNS